MAHTLSKFIKKTSAEPCIMHENGNNMEQQTQTNEFRDLGFPLAAAVVSGQDFRCGGAMHPISCGQGESDSMQLQPQGIWLSKRCQLVRH